LFNYKIAYEIRLQEALEEDFLCPFHYFGVAEYIQNEVAATELDFTLLTQSERVDYILEKAKYYSCSGEKVRGLIFCSRKDEAKVLSEMMNARGMKTQALTGEDSQNIREKAVKKLENDELDYILTVDIFNEGIDIPKINQIIMLRNTQSSIIFIQQLGRGLRKNPTKEYVNVIDFIANYKNNFLIPIALSGDNSGTKENMRQHTFNTNYITGVSTINFEEVAKERVFKSIDQSKINSMANLKNAYETLKNRLGRIPYLYDFEETNSLDPFIFVNGKVTGVNNYYDFLVKMKENVEEISDYEGKILMFFSRELMTGKRAQELVLIEYLLEHKSISKDKLISFFSEQDLTASPRTIASVLSTLDISFYTGQDKNNYEGLNFIEEKENEIILAQNLKHSLKANLFFNQLFLDELRVGLAKAKYYHPNEKLTRYQKYSRKEALRLLDWNEQMVNQNIGGYARNDNDFTIFVTLDKGAEFKGALMAYEDELLSPNVMKWFTKSPRTMKSPEVKVLQNLGENHINVHLFLQKTKEDGDFYYMGEVKPILDSMKQDDRPTTNGKTATVVEMLLHLKEPIDEKLTQYFQVGNDSLQIT
jgi:hypothetical protein